MPTPVSSPIVVIPLLPKISPLSASSATKGGEGRPPTRKKSFNPCSPWVNWLLRRPDDVDADDEDYCLCTTVLLYLFCFVWSISGFGHLNNWCIFLYFCQCIQYHSVLIFLPCFAYFLNILNYKCSMLSITNLLSTSYSVRLLLTG